MANAAAHSTNPDTIKGLERLEREFMVPSIYLGACWEVSANRGETHYVPEDVAGNASSLADYVEGTIDVDDDEQPIATLRQGVYMAQLSAPGYMDQTDLCAFDTLAEAEDYLVETYADDYDDDDTADDDEPTEPEEDDITTQDHETFYQNGKTVLQGIADNGEWFYRSQVPGENRLVVLGKFGSDHVAALRVYMARTNYYPNCWFICDHGNAHLMDLK